MEKKSKWQTFTTFCKEHIVEITMGVLTAGCLAYLGFSYATYVKSMKKLETTWPDLVTEGIEKIRKKDSTVPENVLEAMEFLLNIDDSKGCIAGKLDETSTVTVAELGVLGTAIMNHGRAADEKIRDVLITFA